MTTNIVPIQESKIPAWIQTPLLSKSLGSQEFQKHKALVAFELEVVSKKIDRFGWESERGAPSHDRIMTDWINVLCDFFIDEIQLAIGQILASKTPKDATNEHAVKNRILANRKTVCERNPLEVATQNILSGKNFLCADISASIARELVSRGDVTPEQCKAVGVNL